MSRKLAINLKGLLIPIVIGLAIFVAALMVLPVRLQSFMPSCGAFSCELITLKPDYNTFQKMTYFKALKELNNTSSAAYNGDSEDRMPSVNSVDLLRNAVIAAAVGASVVFVNRRYVFNK